MLVSKDKIKSFLPHRPPFLFIDAVESVELPEGVKAEDLKAPKDLIGTKVKAHFKVTHDLEILKGHFPGNPILPGVVQVEMMAQASAFVSVPMMLDLSTKDVETLLVNVENAKVRKAIIAEMDIVINTIMIKCRGQIASYECFIESSDGEKLSEAMVLAKLVIKDKV